MTPERWKKLDALFHEALALQGEARAAHLAEVCGGDEQLRAKAERLLAAHEREDSFIDSPIFVEAAELQSNDRYQSPVGHSIGPYQVTSLLGRGGMGEVYLAEDTRLERKVALKMLPAAFTNNPERVRRFEREAKAASALNHPNILTIHEIGEANGAHYIVSEFVAGETLRALIERGRLGVSQATAMADQVAGALSVAHEAGIIHRDIKPENVMVRPDGLVKVLDFGLAKLIEQPAAPPVDSAAPTIVWLSSQERVVMGTVSYMSPEQARGQEVDQRTDIFSLGVTLYEMIAGLRPFEGATTSDVIAALLTAEPPPLRRHCAAAPAALEQIVSRCLAKEREARYQTAAELRAELATLRHGSHVEGAAAMRMIEDVGRWFALRRWPLVAALAAVLIVGLVYVFSWRRAPAVQLDQIRSLAVLPLDNLSGDPRQEYLADGMTDELIDELTKIGALRVISRASAMRYKGTKRSLPEIARELNVEAVIEGTVRQLGSRVQVRAQLASAATNQSLWSGDWEQDLRDVPILQSEIARTVARTVQIKLTPAEQVHLANVRPVNAEAYDEYLKGRFYWNQGRHMPGKEEELLYQKSLARFEQAIKIDPDYAPAYLWLARYYLWLADYGYRNQHCFPKAKAAALQALTLDDSLAQAHQALAFILWRVEWDWAGAEREFKRAIALGADSDTHHEYSLYLSAAGRPSEAIAEMNRAQEKNPLAMSLKTNMGLIYSEARQYDRAVEQFKHLLNLAPNNGWVRLNLGVAYAYQRKYEEGHAEIFRATDVQRISPLHHPGGYLAWVYAQSSRRAQAIKLLRELETLAKQWPNLIIEIARTHAVLGHKEQAITWLERAYQSRCYRLLLINSFPEFDGLRSEPRWQELLRRMNYPKAHDNK